MLNNSSNYVYIVHISDLKRAEFLELDRVSESLERVGHMASSSLLSLEF